MKRALLILLSLVYVMAFYGCVPPPPPDEGYHETNVYVNRHNPPRQNHHVNHPPRHNNDRDRDHRRN